MADERIVLISADPDLLEILAGPYEIVEIPAPDGTRYAPEELAYQQGYRHKTVVQGQEQGPAAPPFPPSSLPSLTYNRADETDAVAQLRAALVTLGLVDDLTFDQPAPAPIPIPDPVPVDAAPADPAPADPAPADVTPAPETPPADPASADSAPAPTDPSVDSVPSVDPAPAADDVAAAQPAPVDGADAAPVEDVPPAS